jgi:2-keto-4-pentenoate hydratase/2-oxohepta-3-ene-1,7-dioic acid hydratase in catechol pathway
VPAATRLVRFQSNGSVRFGVMDGATTIRGIAGDIFHTWRVSDDVVDLSDPDVELLAPVEPSKIVVVGRNYEAHATELKELGVETPSDPVISLKSTTALTSAYADIRLPPRIGRTDFEGELALVIGKVCRNVSVHRAEESIFGYTIANDVTARDLQRADGQWVRAKSFDTFCPLGPAIVRDPGPIDELVIETLVNGTVRQHAEARLLIHKPSELVASLSASMTLLPGDVVLTGTPAGVGQLEHGDLVEVSISQIGCIRNRVVVDGGNQ